MEKIECRMSKWAVALIGIPDAAQDCFLGGSIGALDIALNARFELHVSSFPEPFAGNVEYRTPKTAASVAQIQLRQQPS